MREIKFRGKRKDNGKWIEGYLFMIIGKAYILRGVSVVSDGSEPKPIEYEVIPETVGQFTELLDRDSKKIFEGDILTAKSWGGWQSPDDRYVLYSDGQFKLFYKDCKYTLSGFQISKNNTGKYRVVGNIYDNPELIQ